jgi:glycosyltransferase involved in cell wall biosynthesis
VMAPMVSRFSSPKYAGLLEYGGSMGGAYLLRRGLYMPWELPAMMGADMAREGWESLQTVARVNETTARIGGESRDRLAVSAMEMSWYMRHQLLNDADWAGMAHSLEIRVPFVDVSLVKAVVPWLAAYPRLEKSSVARAAAPNLSNALINRPKSGFTVPVRQWLGATTGNRGLRGWAGHVYKAHPPTTDVFRDATSSSRRKPRVLVSTLAPGNGGVNAMTQFVVRVLAERGLEPVIGYYAPYSVVPKLSVPSFRLLQRSAGQQCGRAFGHEAHGIGAWLPELEFTHYAATVHWRRLMKSCDAFVAVSGNALAATPFLQTGRPYLAWVATDWHGDRRDRVSQFPLPRRLLDACVGPIIRRLERKLLKSGRILSLSRHTARTLRALAGDRFEDHLLPIVIETGLFLPNASARVKNRLGFAGRLVDPRKNIALLFDAMAQLRRDGHPVTAVLMGGAPTADIEQTVARLGLEPYVKFEPNLTRSEMCAVMQTLDLFILPSHQEGLCIAALEAMACGVPVVSTRCGGPEEFVLPGRTGQLTASNATDMAKEVAALLGNPGLRSRMSHEARQLVLERYSNCEAEASFLQAFQATFPELNGIAGTRSHVKTTSLLEPVAGARLADIMQEAR